MTHPAHELCKVCLVRWCREACHSPFSVPHPPCAYRCLGEASFIVSRPFIMCTSESSKALDSTYTALLAFFCCRALHPFIFGHCPPEQAKNCPSFLVYWLVGCAGKSCIALSVCQSAQGSLDRVLMQDCILSAFLLGNTLPKKGVPHGSIFA